MIFYEDPRVFRDYLFEDLVWNLVDPRRRITSDHTLSPVLREWALGHAETSVLSLEWLYVWKLASHEVLDSIEIVQAWGLSSSHQSLGNYFEGETPWVLFNFINQVFLELNSASLYASP